MIPQEFVPRPKFEEYKEQFKDYFIMERKNGIISVRMHTNDGPVIFTHQMHQAIGQLWHVIGNDPENELMILTSTGDKWLALGDEAGDEDLHKKMDPTDVSYEFYFYDSNKLVSNLVNDIDIPTIAAINGPGFHTELGLFCDVTLCTPDTEFADRHFMSGWVPGDGQFLAFQKFIGDKRAIYYLYTGQAITAKQAYEWGLVSEIVPGDKIMDRAWEIAEGIMKQHRVLRRVTTQIVKRPTKRLFMDDFDLHIADEFYGLEVTKPRHDWDTIMDTKKK